jgi:hypothetical protein
MGTRARAARCTQHRLELRFAHARRSHMRARRCCGRTKHSASALVDDLITGLLRRGDVRRVPSCRNLRRRTRGAAGGHQRQKPYYLSHCCPPSDQHDAPAYETHFEDHVGGAYQVKTVARSQATNLCAERRAGAISGGRRHPPHARALAPLRITPDACSATELPLRIAVNCKRRTEVLQCSTRSSLTGAIDIALRIDALCA